MKVIIPGGSGHVGATLIRHFQALGHETVVLSRSPTLNRNCRVVPWDGKHAGDWEKELDGADGVINLAGRSVNCRYHASNRQAIMDSRIDSTLAIGRAIEKARRPPRVWLQASTATIYAHRFDAANDERTGVLGDRDRNAPASWKFSIEVAKAWEAAANSFQLPNTRTVLLRSAMTMSPDSGSVFDLLRKLVRFGLGGTLGDGKQYVSWIHELDFCRAIDWITCHEELQGPINVSSPFPLPNREFMSLLRQACRVRWGLPASDWILKLGTFIMQTESELVLKSRRVVPQLLLDSGFAFEYPDWFSAAKELVERPQGSLAIMPASARVHMERTLKSDETRRLDGKALHTSRR